MLTQENIDWITIILQSVEICDKRQRFNSWRDVLHLYEDVVSLPDALQEFLHQE